MANNLSNVVQFLLSGMVQKCGPDHQYEARLPFLSNTRRDISNVMPDLKNLVPDNCFHPKVRVCVDFSYQFTKSSDKIGGKRPLSKDLFVNIGKKLVTYATYYYKYVLTYGKNTAAREYLNTLETEAKKSYSEEFLLEFVNEFINYFMTDVSVERSIGNIGTCSITFRDNQHFTKGVKTGLLYYKTKSIFNQLFVPMLPIMVWAQGRIYKDWWFPLFDGYVTAITPQNNAGYSSVVVNCKDVLELARTSTEMISPALVQAGELKTQNYVNIFAKPLYGMPHFRIVKAMLVGDKLIYDPTLNEVKRPSEAVAATTPKASDYNKKPTVERIDLSPSTSTTSSTSDTGSTTGLDFAALGDFFDADADRNPEVRNSILDYRAIHKDGFNFQAQFKKVSHKRKRAVIAWGMDLTPYRTWNESSPNLFTSEFSSRLQILQEVAGMVYFNFYVDGDGNFHYHPMRVANSFLTQDAVSTIAAQNNHEYTFPYAQVIGLEEIFSTSATLNIEELGTYLRFGGQSAVITNAPDTELNLYGYGTQYDLLQRYGYKRKAFNSPMFNNNPEVFKGVMFFDIAAYALLLYTNGELYTKQASIVFRPEIELAAPVFFVDDKTVFYVQSISHSITIGGDATTSINGNLGRKDEDQPADLYTFMLLSEKLFKQGEDALTDEDRELLMKQIPGKDWIEQTRKLRDAYLESDEKEETSFVTSDKDREQMKQDLSDLWSGIGVNTVSKEETVHEKKREQLGVFGSFIPTTKR